MPPCRAVPQRHRHQRKSVSARPSSVASAMTGSAQDLTLTVKRGQKLPLLPLRRRPVAHSVPRDSRRMARSRENAKARQHGRAVPPRPTTKTARRKPASSGQLGAAHETIVATATCLPTKPNRQTSSHQHLPKASSRAQPGRGNQHRSSARPCAATLPLATAAW